MLQLQKRFLVTALLVLLASPAAFGQGGGSTGTPDDQRGTALRPRVWPKSWAERAGGVATRPGSEEAKLPGGFPEPLFMDPLVQRALHITVEQLIPLGHANRRLRQQLKEDLHDLDHLSPADRTQRIKELRQKYDRDVMRAAAGILDENQMARYRQLSQEAAPSQPASSSRTSGSKPERP
jgi:hypothetical protein